MFPYYLRRMTGRLDTVVPFGMCKWQGRVTGCGLSRYRNGARTALSAMGGQAARAPKVLYFADYSKNV